MFLDSDPSNTLVLTFMILRVRTEEGQTIKINVEATTMIDNSLLKTILDSIQPKPPAHLYAASYWKLIRKSPRGNVEIPFQGKSVASNYGFQNGEILTLLCNQTYMVIDDEEEKVEEEVKRVDVKQDEVDDILDQRDGLIPRQKDPKLCKHGDNGMCEYCMPLEPYDAKYIESRGIKHLSFHAYLKKLNVSAKGNVVTLEEPDYKVKENCTNGHLPYPQGICTRCQPSAIALRSPEYRFTDHVVFDNAKTLNDFIQTWRQSGFQRFGYLYGRYEPYSEVPLGIQAVVCAIYEPKQDGAVDGIEILEDPFLAEVDKVASQLGLTQVGMIYTDLTPDLQQSEKVICTRHYDSYFVSGLEVLFMARAQKAHPHRCKYARTGTFGSKYVTMIVSGDTDGQVGLHEYQVSMDAMAMVDADLIEASTNPSLLLVKPSTPTHYVPEVFYKYKNEYGINVTEAAKPTFDVSYLLVSLSHGGRQSESSFFLSSNDPFPIFNRSSVGFSNPSLTDLQKHLAPALTSSSSSLPVWLRCFSNFHVLLFMKTLEFIHPDDFSILLEAVKDHNEKTLQRFLESESFSTLQVYLEGSVVQQRPGGSSSKIIPWNCTHCTFRNETQATTCEMCALPK